MEVEVGGRALHVHQAEHPIGVDAPEAIDDRLREVSFRGRSSAAMVYDTQPIIDCFRRIDDDRVLGLMDVKGSPPDFYFHLTRD